MEVVSNLFTQRKPTFGGGGQPGCIFFFQKGDVQGASFLLISCRFIESPLWIEKS